MRALRNTVIIGVVLTFIIGFVWFLPMLLNSQYFGLRHKSSKWYSDFTAACDSVLAEHPVGTNEAVMIPVTDSSLPKIIADLHPLKIQVSRQRFWMLLVSDSHAGFGLTWDPKWGDTNIWVLHTTAESEDTIIYSATRTLSN